MSSNYSSEEDDQLQDLESLSERVESARARDPGMFVSAWEKDETDLVSWTAEELERDKGKQLLHAVEEGDYDKIAVLLNEEPLLVNARDSDDYTSLHRASYHGHLMIMKLLLQHGADIHARTVDGWQPIHNATFWNHVEAVDLLLQVGSDVNSVTGSGQTPLHLATSESGHLEVTMRLLNQPGVQTQMANSTGDTPEILAKRNTPYAKLFDPFSSSVILLRPP